MVCSEINSCTYSQLIFVSLPRIYNKERIVSLVNGVGEIGESHADFPPYTKINPKWNTDLTIRPETLQLLEENIGNELLDLGLGSGVLNMAPRAQAMKAKINNCDSVKSKCSA